MKSSRIIGLLVLVIAVSLGAWYILGGADSQPAPIEEASAPPPVNQLPKMNVLSLPEESTMALNSLSGNVVLIFFNPECEHCQDEARLIADNKELFEDYHLYFIASDSLSKITGFAEEYNLKQPNYHFAFGDGLTVFQTMGAINNVPAVFVYRDRKLTARAEGVIALERWKEML